MEVVQFGCKHTTEFQYNISYEFGLSSDHTTTYQDKNGCTMLEGRNGAATAADSNRMQVLIKEVRLLSEENEQLLQRKVASTQTESESTT